MATFIALRDPVTMLVSVFTKPDNLIYDQKCSLFSTLREPSVNRKDLQDLTLVEPTRDNPVCGKLSNKTGKQSTP